VSKEATAPKSSIEKGWEREVGRREREKIRRVEMGTIIWDSSACCAQSRANQRGELGGEHPLGRGLIQP
jgi:hypothetical protein